MSRMLLMGAGRATGTAPTGDVFAGFSNTDRLVLMAASDVLAGTLTPYDLGPIDSGFGGGHNLMVDESANTVYALISVAGKVVKGYSLTTGAEVASVTLATAPVSLELTARRASDGALYVDNTGGAIYRMDSSGGSSSNIGTFGVLSFGLWFNDADGFLYAIGSDKRLRKMDGTSGAVTVVCNDVTGASASISYGLLSYDATAGKFFH
jgi:hypothetical protein